MSNPVFVATYGSLRRGMGNHGVNARAGGEVYGLGKTVQPATLYAYCSGFPSVSLQHQTHQVRVEVYKTTQEGLEGAYDCLEGCYGQDHTANFYNRTPIEIEMDSGETLTAWIYHIDTDYPDRVVDSGDWCTYKKGDKYYETIA